MNTRRTFIKQVIAVGAAFPLLGSSLFGQKEGKEGAPSGWKIGTPSVSYCMGPGFPGGPAMDDAAAKQLAEGGWNLVWCDAKDLDVVQRHGLRAMVINQRLLTPAALPAPKELDTLKAAARPVPKRNRAWRFGARRRGWRPR